MWNFGRHQSKANNVFTETLCWHFDWCPPKCLFLDETFSFDDHTSTKMVIIHPRDHSFSLPLLVYWRLIIIYCCYVRLATNHHLLQHNKSTTNSVNISSGNDISIPSTSTGLDVAADSRVRYLNYTTTGRKKKKKKNICKYC